jgi:hypothetical protein
LEMSIHQLFRCTPFGREEIALLVAGYEATPKKLGLVDRDDPITKILAKKIIELGQRGVRNPKQPRAKSSI